MKQCLHILHILPKNLLKSFKTKLFLPKPMRSPQVETEKLKPHCIGVIEVTS
jgi:hypothetical protein